jgi:hypothetical protein
MDGSSVSDFDLANLDSADLHAFPITNIELSGGGVPLVFASQVVSL